MKIRRILFWLHLVAGVTAGAVILLMSVTGVLLTYEIQVIDWADRDVRLVKPVEGAARLPVESLLASFERQQGTLPASLMIRRDAREAALLSSGRTGGYYVDPYTGKVLGEGSKGTRAFFRKVTEWHRWFAASGENRAAARAVTGAANLLFLFLVVTGAYLWLPRKWQWRNIRPVAVLRGGLSGKARDFHWHNVFGIWCAVPLFFVVLTGVVMSYPWANDLLFRLADGKAARSAPPRREPPRGEAARVSAEGLNLLWPRAEKQVATWKSITLRLPSVSDRAVQFTIDEGNGRQPQKRATLTLDRRSGSLVRWEPFESNSLGRRLRSWVRFGHTGEALGVVGQTIAGVASAAGVLLVWTGIALALRRFFAWKRRGVRVAPRETREKVAV
ncbi:MAG: hypothetical protein IANPNBLG_00244 [Bryobacteraceae bacterium]|nr:hypothetical protein [Bryobacteraceae bacterium]